MAIERLLLAIGTILLAVRVFGWLLARVGQPRVVGEMAAGIVLGPSLLGYFFPDAVTYLFPPSSFTALSALSQIGVLLFMFLVGLEVDLNEIMKQRLAIVATSNFSILVPFIAGIGLARWLYPRFAEPHVPFLLFGLFVGTAMSITAFPVLARILQERNLLRSEIGSMAISCAAIDDLTAWLLLAILTTMVHSAQSWWGFALMFLKLLLFVAFMLFPGRKILAGFKTYSLRHGHSVGLVSVVILVILAASWTTEQIGVHALFGAFIAGLVMPKDKSFATGLLHQFESFTLAFLLPLFFALTGLRTRLDLIYETRAWGYALAIIAVAILGKFAGTSVICYFSGLRWRDSAALGILMNTRGLVELVVLNIGLELGILSPALFTLMVLMALVTTCMAAPILSIMKLGEPHLQISTVGFDTEPIPKQPSQVSA